LIVRPEGPILGSFRTNTARHCCASANYRLIGRRHRSLAAYDARLSNFTFRFHDLKILESVFLKLGFHIID
jgi:hypothetical protein